VPQWLAPRADADDFVQLAAMRTLRRLHHLSPERLASIQPYMRRTVVNLMRDELRKIGRGPETIPIDPEELPIDMSPLDALVGRTTWDSYKAALRELTPRERKAVVARIQRGESYEEIRQRIDAPSIGATRAAVTRAIHRVVVLMSAPRPSAPAKPAARERGPGKSPPPR
jgi:RNA polymerase sigma factor (sigma-70 family)